MYTGCPKIPGTMEECQLMLENNEKNNKKNSILLRYEDMGAQKVQLSSHSF
jgi:hypothetical protein